MRRSHQVYLVFFSIFLIAVIFFTRFFSYPPTYQVDAWSKLASPERMKLNTKQRELRRFLQNIAREDNFVIITALNEEWMASNSILDLFIESFQIGENTKGLLRHLLILAMDQRAFEHCKSKHVHCYLLNSNNLDTEESFAAHQKHVDEGTRQLDFMHTLLVIGYNFIYTDLDVMWLRNPLYRIVSFDYITLSTDFFHGNYSLGNSPNGGFMHIMSCDQSADFFLLWRVLWKLNSGLDRQMSLMKALNRAANAPFRISARYLDTAHFGGFCQYGELLDPSKVSTLQTNCCKDMQEKLHGLRGFMQDWKNYTSLPVEVSRRVLWNISFKCRN